MRVVVFGTFDERLHPRVRVLRDGLAESGHDVQVVNVPLGFDTAARVKLAAQPWRIVPFAMRLLVAWARLLVRSATVRRPEVVLVGYLGAFDIHLARLRWRRSFIALDQMVQLGDTVRDRAVGSGGLTGVLDRLDHWAALQADLVICDTEEQAAEVRGPTPTVVVAVGAPAGWFVTPAPDPAPDAPVECMFFGLYQQLQGATVIGRALALVPAGTPLRMTMIGTGQDRAAAEEAAAATPLEVQWLDWVAPEDLPAQVARHHVCLGIFDAGPKAARVVPNKVFQGAAAGCAIVTGDTTAQRRVVGSAARYTAPGDPQALADELVRLATDRDLLTATRDAARSWAEASASARIVVEPLAQRLRASVPPPS